MWDLSMFFYEVRLAFSLYLLGSLWYKMGLLDWYLHRMLVRVGAKVLMVPVIVESLSFYFPNTVIITGIRVKPPPPEVDNRWEWDNIITVDLIDVKFDFALSALVYFLSYGELSILESVYVHGLRFYVEGYRATPTDETTFNFSLLGAKPKKKEPVPLPSPSASTKSKKSIKERSYQNQPLLAEAEEGNATIYGKIESVEGYFSESDDAEFEEPTQNDSNNGDSQPNCDSKDTPPATETKKEGRRSFTSYVKSTTKAFFHMTEKVKTEARNFNDTSIDMSIKERIKMLHTRISGPEPGHIPGEPRFICDLVIFDGIEVHMLRALPVQIRHLESKPLTVSKLQFDHLGYEGLTVRSKLSTGSNSRSTSGSGMGSASTHRSHHARGSFSRPHSPRNSPHAHPEEPVQISFAAIGDGIIVAKDKDRERGNDSGRSSPSVNTCGSLCHRRSSHKAAVPLNGSGGDSRPEAHNGHIDSTSPTAKGGEHPSSSADGIASTSEEQQSPEKTHPTIAHFPDRVELDPWSIDLYNSGLDVLVFKYRFEQQLMLALYQGNAGRLIVDVLNISNWSFSKNGGSASGQQTHSSSGSGSGGGNGNGGGGTRSQPPARVTTDNPPSSRPSMGSAPAVGGAPSAALYNSRRDDDIIYFNPLFFEET